MCSAPEYLFGFGNEHQSEALPGALPIGQFSPQRPPYGLYAEQLSHSAFTVGRQRNRRSWLYRIRPAVLHGEFAPLETTAFSGASESPCSPANLASASLNQQRWSPFAFPETSCDFLQGVRKLAANGSARNHQGIAIYYYTANSNTEQRYFYNADAETLLIPQQGELQLDTEFGQLKLSPGHIAVIPRGVKHRITLLASQARGYLCENYASPFELPDRGLIGANGLANERDFYYPRAQFEEQEQTAELWCKFDGELYCAELQHSPFDVVAWCGNSAPYGYDLAHFNVINSVSFDHPDPSIFTVLSSPSPLAGIANCDFVIFPPRWLVSEHSFRPPYFHRNIMSEFMGLIRGEYDGKATGFLPGGASLHNCMAAHGPDTQAFERASNAALQPQRYENTLAFMLETSMPLNLTAHACLHPSRQRDYRQCWDGLVSHFDAQNNHGSATATDKDPE